MLNAGIRRAFVVWDRSIGRPRASHPLLEPVARSFAKDPVDYKQHEAVFLEIGPITGYILGAFVLRTCRGAAAGGVRFWNYRNFESYLQDGLRLAIGMTRKNALAGIWWGGGKGVIAVLDPFQAKSRPFRDRLFSEYGSFISSIHGCYITAEDLGVTTIDIDRVFLKTRYTTCISEHLGGNGNPSIKTGWGIVCGIEAALEYLGRGGVEGKTVAVMGCGNVCMAMTERLLEKRIGSVIAADSNAEAVERFNRVWAGKRARARVAVPGDFSILAEDVDVVSPCAVGGVINPSTIAAMRSKIVCGSANNQLADDTRDEEQARSWLAKSTGGDLDPMLVLPGESDNGKVLAELSETDFIARATVAGSKSISLVRAHKLYSALWALVADSRSERRRKAQDQRDRIAARKAQEEAFDREMVARLGHF